jgi:hypothetical protein
MERINGLLKMRLEKLIRGGIKRIARKSAIVTSRKMSISLVMFG